MSDVDRIYAVSARIGERTDGGEIWRDVPTFYLFANVQGILSEDQAARVARRILGDPELCSVCAVETSAGGPGTAHPLISEPIARGVDRAVSELRGQVSTLASTLRWIAERPDDSYGADAGAERRAARAAMTWLESRRG